MSIKEKAVTGLKWSFVDTLANQGSQFLAGIILARLLTPREFGLVGMLTFFIALSQTFIDSGFSQGLIRKNNCGQEEYSTVFYFNLTVGSLCYLIIYLSAGRISVFFKEPQLVPLVRVLGVILLINSAALIQRTILVKNIDFKLQTRVSIIASVISGTISIAMACYGWGVWSLVIRTITHGTVSTVLLWGWSRWRPRLIFKLKSFNELFFFGSKLLLSALLETTYQNIFYLVIGKTFAAKELGYYARADEFRNIPSTNLTAVIDRVSYPILASVQDDAKRLKDGYRRVIKGTMLITFGLMIGMAAVAKPMILVLIGEKWLPAVPYLRLLCFVGALYPLHALNLNVLKVKGRSDLFLRLEVIKKILAVPTILIGLYFGITAMIVAMLANSVIAYGLNSYWSGQMINYPIWEQIRDIAPSLAIAIVTGAIVFVAGSLLTLKPVLILCVQITMGVSLMIGISRLIRLDTYIELRNIFSAQFLVLTKQRGAI